MKHFIAVVLCALVAACAGLDGTAPAKLLQPPRLTSFTLKTDAIGEMTSTNAFGSKTTYTTGLRKGKYISVFVDGEGTYYQGDKGCLYNSAINRYLDGGIWMPNKDSALEPRFWTYLKRVEPGEYPSAGPLLVGLANMNAGNVKKEWSTKIEPFLLRQVSIQDE